jgi:hypothetical protein
MLRLAIFETSPLPQPWRADPTRRRTILVLVLTTCLGLLCGMAQLATLSAVPTFLPVGCLLAAGYLLLVLSRRLEALALFGVAFVEFWGLLQESFQIGDVKLLDMITAAVAVPIIVDLASRGFPFRGTAARPLRLGAWILLVLIAGEVFLTVAGSGQSFWLSVKAAKPYLYYFGFLLVPVYAGTPEKVRRLASWLTAIASGLAFVYLLISFTGEIATLPGLVVGEANFVGLGTFTRVRSNGAPLIVAMLLYQFYRYADGRASRLEKLSLLVLAMGAMVHFYRSLWVGILAGIVVQASIEGKRGARNLAKFFLALIVLSVGIGAVHPEYGGMILSRAMSTVTEVEQLSGSYGVRHEQIERWAPILRENYLVGIGFLHHDSPLGQQMEALYMLEGTGNYDVGWVDLLGRLGIIGIALLVLGLYLLSKEAWRARSYGVGGDITVLRRTQAAWIVLAVVSLPGYPLLSSGYGILPFSILTGMLAVLEESVERAPAVGGGLKKPRSPAMGEVRGAVEGVND